MTWAGVLVSVVAGGALAFWWDPKIISKTREAIRSGRHIRSDDADYAARIRSEIADKWAKDGCEQDRFDLEQERFAAKEAELEARHRQHMALIRAEAAARRAQYVSEQAQSAEQCQPWRAVTDFLDWLDTQPNTTRRTVGAEVRSLAADPDDTESFAEAFRIYVGGDITGDNQ